jgi:WD40 repeat protein
MSKELSERPSSKASEDDGKEQSDSFRYWAFISYSHRDAKWGMWLHRQIETYRVPKKLVGQISPAGPLPRRLFPIFRDREELAASANLPIRIEEALHQSRTLIVVCSPRATRSRWVNEEIKSFKRLGRTLRIFALIVDGEPNTSDENKGVAAEQECFPEAMRYRIEADGTVSSICEEPLASDVRPGKDGRANAKLRLLAGILGVGFDILRQREHERWIRRLIGTTVGAGSLAVAFALLGINLFFQTNAAIENATELKHELSQSDFLQASQLLSEGENREGTAHLARALRLWPENWSAIQLLWHNLFAGRRSPVPPLQHQGSVNDVKFAPDGDWVVTASDDGMVRVWDIKTGKLRCQPMQHQGIVKTAEFSPDGQLILSASADGTARLWDATTGVPRAKVMQHDDVVNMAVFSPDGRYVLTACNDGAAHIWDSQTGDPIGHPMRGERVTSIARFSPDGKKIVSVSGTSAYFWDGRTGDPLGEPLDHGRAVMSAMFNYNGSTLITTSATSALLWDTETRQPMGQPLEHDTPVDYAEFSPDGRKILTVAGSTIQLWDARTFDASTLSIKCGGTVHAATFSPDGLRILSISEGKIAQLWDANDGTRLGPPMRHNEEITAAAFSRDGREFVTGCRDKTAQLWLSQINEPLMVFLQEKGPIIGALVGAFFSPGGNRALTVRNNSEAQLWDVNSGGRIGDSVNHDFELWRPAFSSDGLRLLTAVGENKARLWDPATGEPIGNVLEHKGRISSAVFSPDGRLALTASWDGTAQLWDARSGYSWGSALRQQDVVWSAVFRPDGKAILTVSQDGTAQMWDVQTCRPMGRSFEHPSGFKNLIFSPDGRKLLMVFQDYTMRLWNSDTGQPIGQPMEHNAEIREVKFSPDGSRILSTSDDNTARLWDSQTGKPIGNPLQHYAEVTTGAFSSNGRWVLTASRDETARLWSAQSGESLNEPMHALGGSITGVAFGCDDRLIVTLSGLIELWDTHTCKSLGHLLDFGGWAGNGVVSPDGNSALTIDDIPALSRLGICSTPSPAWLSDFVDALDGMRLEDNGALVQLTDAADRLQNIKQELAGRDLHSGNLDEQHLRNALWFLADRTDGRPISPWSTIELGQYLSRNLSSMKESPRARLWLLSEIHPLVSGKPHQ